MCEKTAWKFFKNGGIPLPGGRRCVLCFWLSRFLIGTVKTVQVKQKKLAVTNDNDHQHHQEKKESKKKGKKFCEYVTIVCAIV